MNILVQLVMHQCLESWVLDFVFVSKDIMIQIHPHKCVRNAIQLVKHVLIVWLAKVVMNHKIGGRITLLLIMELSINIALVYMVCIILGHLQLANFAITLVLTVMVIQKIIAFIVIQLSQEF